MSGAAPSTIPCRGRTCTAAIVMQQLIKKDGTLGKMAPYDYPPEPCECGGGGAWCNTCKGSGLKWISHFATCPDSPRFRK